MMNDIASELLKMAREVVHPERRVKILQRANEHEMNVDSDDEKPVREFDKLVRLINKAGKDGKRLSDSEWLWLQKTVDTMGPV